MSLFEGSQADTAGFVLAGGQSSRMGSDKAMVRLGGQPLITYALATLREVGLTPLIAGSRSDLSRFAPVIPDPEMGAGPLSGICAALAWTVCERSVFVSVDTPFLPASLIRGLVEHARTTDAVVSMPSVNGFAQTFPAVINRAALPHLESELRRGEGGSFAAFRHATRQLDGILSITPVELLIQAGRIAHPTGLPGAYWFLNANTPQDLARAEALMSHRVI